MNALADGLRPVEAVDFNVDLTLGCGQVFHWRRVGGGYTGAIGDRPVYVEQSGDRLLVTAGTEETVRRYFALDHRLPTIYASFPKDPVMDAALAACRGLRIIRQPLWECLASFITSSLKQVAHIAQISHRLRERFGQQVGQIGEIGVFSYPTLERVGALDEAALRACGLGFRARSLLETARSLADSGGSDALEGLRLLDRPTALAALTRFRGVGTKVANCVLLFGYEHLDAFPIDVWIERVLREAYFAHEPDAAVGKLQRFSEGYFGPYGGYAQQYLFHHARIAGRKPRVSGVETQGEAAPMRRVRKSTSTTGGNAA